MLDKLKIKRGFSTTGDSEIAGSLTVTGTVSGSFVGSGAGLTGLSAFPFTGSAQITGSLGVTGSIFSTGQSEFYGSIRSLTSNSSNAIGVQNTFSTSNTATSIELTRPSAGGSYFSGNGNTKILFHSQTKTNTYMQVASEYYSRAIRTVISADADSGAYAGNQIEFHVAGWGVAGGATAASLRMLINKTGQVAIGTPTPTSTLHVKGSGATSATTALRVENTNTSASLVVLDNSSVGIGAAPSESIRLDIRAQGTGTTPEFRVRNSTDTANLITVQGNQFVGFQQNAQFGFYQLQINTDGSVTSRVSGTNSPWKFNNSSGILCSDIGVENGVGKLGVVGAITAFGITDNRVLTFGVGGKAKLVIGGDISNTTQLPSENSSNIIFFRNGTAPTLNLGDAYQQYSADITAGNAAPHFRTENGSIIKLYKEIQPALSGSANTGDPATDALIEAMKTIILNLGFGSSS